MTESTAVEDTITVEQNRTEGGSMIERNVASTELDSSVVTNNDNTEYGYVPEKFLKNGQPDFESLSKSYTELETKLRTTRPTAAKSVEDYSFDFPEGFSTDEEMTNSFKQEALEVGLSPEQYQFVMSKYAESINSAVGFTQESAQKELSEYWGQNFDDNLGNAQFAFREIGQELNLDVDKVGNDPSMLKVLAWIGSQMREDDVTDVHGTSTDPGLSDTEIADLMNRPDYYSSKEIQAKVAAAFEARRR